MPLKHFKFFFFLFAICLFSCSSRSIQSSAKVNYLASKDGTITMRAIGVGENQQAAIADAEKNAFEVLFFRGLPGSEQKIALIGTNEITEKQKNQIYFDNLFAGQRYKTFLMSSISSSNVINVKGGGKSISVDVEINVAALRRDLEQNSVIRKFGF